MPNGELDALFKDTQRAGVYDDGFDVDAALKEPAVTKLGDLWLLGEHRLACGDSTKREQYIACKFGVPYTHWEIDRGGKAPRVMTQRTTEQIDGLYNRFDTHELFGNAIRLLEAFGRS